MQQTSFSEQFLCGRTLVPLKVPSSFDSWWWSGDSTVHLLIKTVCSTKQFKMKPWFCRSGTVDAPWSHRYHESERGKTGKIVSYSDSLHAD